MRAHLIALIFFGFSQLSSIPGYSQNTDKKFSADIAIGDGTIMITREGAAQNEKPYLNVLLTCIGKKTKGIWHISAVRLIVPM